MRPFEINYRSGSIIYHFKIELIESGKQLEKFRISGGNKVVILQSNRPMLLARGLKKKAIYWKVLEGEICYPSNLNNVIKIIEAHLQPEEPKKSKNNIRSSSAWPSKSPRKQKTGPSISLAERMRNGNEPEL